MICWLVTVAQSRQNIGHWEVRRPFGWTGTQNNFKSTQTITFSTFTIANNKEVYKPVINFELSLLIKWKLPALLQCIMICRLAMIKINTYTCRFSVIIFRANRPIDCIFLCLQVRNRQRNSPTYWGPRFCHLNNIKPKHRTYLFNNKDKRQYLRCFSLDATFSYFNLL